VRYGGFPCRFDGCDVRFSVEKSDSYPSLLEASAKRTEHEIAEHQYHHVIIKTDAPPTGSLQRLPRRVQKRID
jgi:hypothetical protein